MPTLSHERAHFDAIKSKHPDWVEIARSQGFFDWLLSQPKAVQRAVDEGNAQDVILVLDQYKAVKREGAFCTRKS